MSDSNKGIELCCNVLLLCATCFACYVSNNSFWKLFTASLCLKNGFSQKSPENEKMRIFRKNSVRS